MMFDIPKFNLFGLFKVVSTTLPILLAALAARVYLLVRIPFVSPDSYLYLQQAKALYYGRFEKLLACYHYLSPYPILVSLFYSILGDWIIAAKCVNIAFSLLSIVFFYYLVLRLFDDSVASFTTLTFALLPCFVRVSVDGLRDPMFWAFSILGLYLFVTNLDNQNRKIPLLLSGLSFLIAFWARVEAIWYIFASLLWLISPNRKNKISNILYFLGTYIPFLLAIIFVSKFLNIEITVILSPDRINKFLFDFIYQYQSTKDNLTSLIQPETPPIIGYFLERVKKLLWLIAPLALIVLILEAFMYIYSILFLSGIINFLRSKTRDLKICYFFFVALGAFFVLIFHTLYIWHAAERHLAVFLIPSFIFVGIGFDTLYSKVNSRFKSKRPLIIGIIYIFITLTLLPKILSTDYDPDMVVYRDIGRFLSSHSQGNGPITVCAPFKQVRDIHFYANYNSTHSPCLHTASFFKDINTSISSYACQHNFQYLVLKDAKSKATHSPIPEMCRLDILKQWNTKTYGILVLYEVVK